MAKIKFNKPTSAETNPYSAMENVQYGAIVEARIDKKSAFVKGETLIEIGADEKAIKPQAEYIWGDWELLEE